MIVPGKVAFGGKSGFRATWQAAHVDIEQVKAGLVVMMKTLTVLLVDFIKCLLQLGHIFCGTGIQRLLDDRLLSTCASAKGSLQCWIGSQTRIDFYQSMGSGQQANEGIRELINRRLLDGFLLDPHQGADRVKQLELAQFYSNGRQMVI
jgi:hypothetical protein